MSRPYLLWRLRKRLCAPRQRESFFIKGVKARTVFESDGENLALPIHRKVNLGYALLARALRVAGIAFRLMQGRQNRALPDRLLATLL